MVAAAEASDAAADLRGLAEAASFFGVSQPTLKRWIDAGAPVAERGSNGVSYRLSLRAIADWRRGQAEAETAEAEERAARDAQLRLELLGGTALTAGDAGAAALTPAQRAAALQEEVARTKLAQLRRELVPAEEEALALGETLAALKTRLRQIPDVAAPELGLDAAGMGRLAALIDDALAETADAIEARMRALLAGGGGAEGAA